MNMPTSPSAPGSSWTTPARLQAEVVGAVPPTNEVAPPSAIAQPGGPSLLGDDASGTVADAVAGSEARYHAHEVLTHPQGSALGVPLDLPPVLSDVSQHTGGINATSYDPAGWTMANRYALANFTVGADFVWLGSVRDSASATVIAYPAGFSVTPTAPAGTPLGDYLVVRPAGPWKDVPGGGVKVAGPGAQTSVTPG